MPFICGTGCGQSQRRSLAYPLIADVRLRIQLGQQSKTFSPGDLISGTLEVTVRRSGTFDRIRVCFLGTASTYWTEQSGRAYIPCGGSETFYSIETSILDLDERGKRSSLPVNTMVSFPFEFQLCADLPPSTLDLDGCCSIRYELCASIQGIQYDDDDDDDDEDDSYGRSQGIFNSSESTPVYVRPFVEIDADSAPVANSAQTTLECCAWTCIFGQVEVEISLPRRAFIPKDFLPVSVSITNLSKITVDKIALRLIQVISLSDKNRYRQHQRKAVLQTSEVYAYTSPGETSEHFFENFRVPETRPSMRNCALITIGYAVEAEISFKSRFANPLRVSCGVLIGSALQVVRGITELQPTVEDPFIEENNASETPSPEPAYTLNDIGECKKLRPTNFEHSSTSINSVD